ncbi:MAG: AAA family ATPase [Candidatus Riflebacteria bacterium]|nr:AAA family ATPase [Candidatus Riflebacteria bacterium]
MSEAKLNLGLIPPAEIDSAHQLLMKLTRELDRAMLGRPVLHRLVIIGILSRGHILFEGVPGVGKTALIKILCQLFQLQGSRIQFTPDLMPGDILGTHILQEKSDGTREMVFQSGPIFSNLILADEINRASPKTQSALLEAMQERCVTLIGKTRQLPIPFFVLASQNPIEMEGTYPLPEAQLDRFMFKLQVGTADAKVLEQIISERRRGDTPTPEFRLSADELKQLFEIHERIFLPKPVASYISRIVSATHPSDKHSTEGVKRNVSHGASPRAAIAIAEAARAEALFNQRATVGFEDVNFVCSHVLNHRIILNYQAKFDGIDTNKVISEILKKYEPGNLDLPDEITLSK